MLKPKSFKIAF